jgi:hypothetical protein
VLLAVTPREELAAFGNLDKQNNPLRISECQAAVLLYCLLDNDAAVALPLLRALVQSGERFDERFAGDMLPDILKEVVASHAKRSLPAEERERLRCSARLRLTLRSGKGKAYTGRGLAVQGTVSKLFERFIGKLADAPDAILYVQKAQPAGGDSKHTALIHGRHDGTDQPLAVVLRATPGQRSSGS